MNAIVHARLDPATLAILRELQKKHGWSESQIVRRAIRALSDVEPRATKRRIHGLGKFASGVADLGSDKRHLRGFGSK